jgi:hypothetical protein
MSARDLPAGARKLADPFYGDGTRLSVWVKDRCIFIRNATNGGFPRLNGHPSQYPGDGTELGDFSYETLGLYYDLSMPETGWDGDC